MDYPRAGTLLIPSGTYHNPNKRHLFIVCTETKEDGTNLLVPISTWINDLCDDTCRLAPHEHAFIRHDSYVLYRKARTESAQNLHDGVAAGLFQTREPVNAQVLLRVVNGVCRSIHTPRKFKLYLDCP